MNVSHKRTNTAWFHLYEMSKIVKLREADGRILPGTGSGETGSYYSMGVKFQLYRMNKFYRSAVQHYNIHLKLCQEVDPMLCSTHTHTHTHMHAHSYTHSIENSVFSALRIRGWHSQLLESEWVRRESWKAESQRDHVILYVNDSQISDWLPYHVCLRQAERYSTNYKTTEQGFHLSFALWPQPS